MVNQSGLVVGLYTAIAHGKIYLWRPAFQALKFEEPVWNFENMKMNMNEHSKLYKSRLRVGSNVNNAIYLSTATRLASG